ncbi:hypothetical protein A33Q_2521 [Indibacter alkaliphilus LW1]|uniref:Secreted protein n=1 Tax=Indibacter alkaliphilus (strain CCUG 57479 / KCTC 22604 / LW1) TaxID=1189612 RepID=S2E1G6_INDAL|nr:hypothetical protein [Indibacter alkaliphilus]EOZ95928.1 hypothetical protein A33Q_2521 [Indibacter alkaliphilus LW1]
MKKIFTLLFALISYCGMAQEKPGNQIFWDNLKKHCGKAYAGEIMTPSENDPFTGKKLIMHVVDCGEDFIHIPFFVGDDKSRTWVLTMQDGRIKLKHDHRHEDGSEDEVTQYGGTASNTGLEKIQFFPADQETTDLIPYASSNVWWITLDEDSFTYNLRRIGSERYFSVKFDLSTEVKSPGPAWGY